MRDLWYDEAMDKHIADHSNYLRCKRTNNLCGTDTITVGHECPCETCKEWESTRIGHQMDGIE